MKTILNIEKTYQPGGVPVDTQQLAAFVRIVREGSFSRAALALDIAQPTISARIRSLEAEVGGPLFARRGRGIGLTPRGESFLAYAQRALDVLAEGVEAAALVESGQRGRVTLGTIPSLAGGLLAGAVAQFRTTHPRVDLYIRSGHSEQVMAMLMDGVVGMGLLRSPVFHVELITLLRFREPLVLVVAPFHRLAQADAVTLDEVRVWGTPLLLVRWGAPMRGILERLGTTPEIFVEVPIETVRYLLLRGNGAAFLTRTLVADDVAAGRLLEITLSDVQPLFSDSMLVCRTPAAALSRAAESFVDALRREAGALCLPE